MKRYALMIPGPMEADEDTLHALGQQHRWRWFSLDQDWREETFFNGLHHEYLLTRSHAALRTVG